MGTMERTSTSYLLWYQYCFFPPKNSNRKKWLRVNSLCCNSLCKWAKGPFDFILVLKFLYRSLRTANCFYWWLQSLFPLQKTLDGRSLYSGCLRKTKTEFCLIQLFYTAFIYQEWQHFLEHLEKAGGVLWEVVMKNSWRIKNSWIFWV